jgi:hypothetical protein
MPAKTMHPSVKVPKDASGLERARPILHQHAREIQPFGKINKLPIALDERACAASVELLNQLLADTMTLSVQETSLAGCGRHLLSAPSSLR